MLGLGSLLALGGCGGALDTNEEPPTGSVSGRQRRDDSPPAPPSGDGAGATCNADEDCTEVLTGDVCACDCNAVTAMHVSDARAYAESHPRPRCDAQCEPCAARGVTCDAGRCALVR